MPTRVLGRQQPEPSWLSLAGTGMTVREFLSHLDAWVYLGRWDDEAELAALEAPAAGLPCVLHEDAAVSGLTGPVRYVQPKGVRVALEELLGHTPTAATSANLRQSEWGRTLERLRTSPGEPTA
uniref:Uncharacterized protein n=1 Tax=Janibacter limosus TaxID=53458 RepID=A0AC61U5J2_9MICO|nr:hypothetical protein [Janibacter limosus]